MKLFKRSLPILLLVIIEGVLLATNYKPGTYLVGWDNLMPEFNFALNFKRAIFSLWQEYRGLGLVDGMANSATLLHTTYVYLLSFFLPQHLLRYVFIHLTHLVGGIGFYFLLSYLLYPTKNDLHKVRKLEKFIPSQLSLPAFLGSLFYMFNIGVIQMYFAPLEVFAVHFAALPWLALVITQTLRQPTRKHFALLFLVSVLTSPQGFVPTVFIAFLILFAFLLLFHLLHTRQLKLVLLIGLTVFLANAFWLLPYVYSAIKTPEIIANTRINQYGSEEIFYRNKAHGDLANVLGLNGFMINTIEYDNTKQSDVFFMNTWKEYETTLWYQLPYVLLLVIGLVGGALIIMKRKHEYYAYLAAFAVAFFFLGNDIPGLEQINTFLRSVFPLLGEAFRFPFTKFITLFAFCLSVFVSLGFAWIVTKLRYWQEVVLAVVGVALVITTAVPAFQGNFTSPLLRLSIPQDYFSLMDYLKGADQQARIAVLPAHTFWNWHYRTWGHRGSGFLWYGVAQPMLERAFDPWSLANEQYYNEMSQAINSQNQQQLNSVLSKYDIGYVYVDQYVINTLSTQPINYNSLTTFLSNDPALGRPLTFGRLLLYPVKNQYDFTYALTHRPANTPSLPDTRVDQAHLSFGDYISDSTQPLTTTYLLPSLFTEKLQSDNAFTVTQTSDAITLRPKQQTFSFPQGSVLRVPDMFASEYLIPVSLRVQDSTLIITPLYPEIYLNKRKLDLPVTPITVPLTMSGKPTKVTFTQLNQTVDLTSAHPYAYLVGKTPDNTLLIQNDKQQESVTLDTTKAETKDLLVPLPTTAITDIAVTFAKIQSPLSVTNIMQDHSYQTQKNVDHLEPFSDSYAHAISLGDKVTLQAKSATEELVFYKDNLFHQASYLLLTDLDYGEGLPINFYLDNPFEHRAELQQDFVKEDTTEVTVIPPTQEFFKGYGFHFTVKSVGTELGESTLSNIELFPFPQKTIEQTAIVSPAEAQVTRLAATSPLPAVHPEPMKYVLPISANQQTVVLAQAYDAGWQAYSFAQAPNAFQKLFPFLGGHRLTDHFQVNSWSNGWSLASTADRGYVVLLYRPLYLQCFGLLTTFITLLGGGIWLFIRRHKA